MSKKKKNNTPIKSGEKPKTIALSALRKEFDLEPEPESTASTDANSNYLNPTDYFINPYTFIPVSGAKPRGKVMEEGDKTGLIECSIEIKSPTFIPNTTKKFIETVNVKNERNGNVSQEDHPFYEFYSYDDLSELENTDRAKPENPVIPGSELRGMVRNIYEQLTNSCFLEVDEDNWPYKRTPQPKEPVVLKYQNDKWHMYTSSRPVKISTDIIDQLGRNPATRLNQGDRLDITGNGNNMNVIKNPQGQYTIHLTGIIQMNRNRKNHQLAYKDEVSGNEIELDDAVINRFEKVVDSYCNKKINKKGDWQLYESYRAMYKAKKTILAYVDSLSRPTYLSPSCMTKEFFVNTIDKILCSQAEHNKCNDPSDLCPACSLFGMIGDKDSNASRVRFTDTSCYENVTFMDEVVLPILATPKISATEFYLKEPEIKDHNGNAIKAAMWNYDYCTNYRDMGRNNPPQYIKKDSSAGYVPQIMGRKVYWHGSFKGDNNIEKRDMNCSVRPIDVGGIFRFRVYFENATEAELKKLIFALSLNNKGVHKIGKGKPIGMGDVIVSVDSVRYRKYEFSGEKTLTVSDVPDAQLAKTVFEEKGIVKDILAYTMPLSENETALVTYPSARDGTGKIYEWFGKNRGTTIQRPTIDQTLPNIRKAKALRKN